MLDARQIVNLLGRLGRTKALLSQLASISCGNTDDDFSNPLNLSSVKRIQPCKNIIEVALQSIRVLFEEQKVKFQEGINVTFMQHRQRQARHRRSPTRSAVDPEPMQLEEWWVLVSGG